MRQSEGGFPLSCDSGYGMVVDLDKRPGSKVLERFSRALRILRLEPYIYESQRVDTLAHVPIDDRRGREELATDLGQESSSAWPRPMLLVRSAI